MTITRHYESSNVKYYWLCPSVYLVKRPQLCVPMHSVLYKLDAREGVSSGLGFEPSDPQALHKQ